MLRQSREVGNKPMETHELTQPKFMGMYGIPEAARYLAMSPPLTNGLSIHPKQLHRWVGANLYHPAPQMFPSRTRLITFLDLVSLRIVAVLRSRGVKPQHIREADDWLRTELDIPWPLASQPLWTYGSQVFVVFEERLIAASLSGQQAMSFLKDWLSKADHGLAFDEQLLASSWSPQVDVRLDPRFQFGEPCIDGTRIPTRAIYSKLKAGDSIDTIASLYGLGQTQVLNAQLWEERLVAA